MDTHRRISYKRNLWNWLMVTQEVLGERKLKFLNCSSLIEEYSTTTYGHPSAFSKCSLLHLFPEEDKCSRFFALLDVAQVLLQWKCRKIWFKYRSLFLLLEYLFIGYFRSVFSEVHKQLLFLPFFHFVQLSWFSPEEDPSFSNLKKEWDYK